MKKQKNKLKILDVGCGFHKTAGAIGIDILSASDADIVHNLNQFPWPLSENEFDLIIAQDVLEHLDDFPKVMAEIYRIAKPGAKLKIRVPHFSSSNAFTDPTHKHFFSTESFNYFIPGTIYYQDYPLKTIKLVKDKVHLVGASNFWTPISFIRRHFTRFYEKHLAFIFPIDNIIFEFKIIK